MNEDFLGHPFEKALFFLLVGAGITAYFVGYQPGRSVGDSINSTVNEVAYNSGILGGKCLVIKYSRDFSKLHRVLEASSAKMCKSMMRAGIDSLGVSIDEQFLKANQLDPKALKLGCVPCDAIDEL